MKEEGMMTNVLTGNCPCNGSISALSLSSAFICHMSKLYIKLHYVTAATSVL